MTPQQKQELRTFNKADRLEAIEIIIQEAQRYPSEFLELKESIERFARPIGDLNASNRCRYCGK